MTEFDNWDTELENSLDQAIKIGNDKGINEFEVFMTRISSVNAELLNGLVNAKNGGQVGVGIRVIDDNKIGMASSSGINEKSINFAFDNAQAVAKSLVQVDDKWKGLYSEPATGKDGIIDHDIVNYDSEKVVNHMNEVIKETKKVDDRIFSVGGSFSSTFGVIGVANSEGILKSSKRTSVTGGMNVQAKEGDKIKSDSASIFRRTVPESLTGLLIPSAEKVIQMLKSKPFGGNESLPVIFENSSSSQMVGRSLGNAINGESVINNRSAFADKIGSEVATTDVTIFDDGQYQDAPGTVAIDTEGVAKQTTTIMDDGVLMSYIFDNYHANIYDVDPTGNSVRISGQSYETSPSIGLNTLRMNPGDKPVENILSEVDRGVFLTGGFMGLHTTNVISGDFSIVNQQAFLVENGEVVHALDPITIAGNHYEFFKNIVQIGNEQEIKPGFFSPPSIIPSLEVEGLSISG